MNVNLKYYCFCRFKLNTDPVLLCKEVNALFMYDIKPMLISQLSRDLSPLDHVHFKLIASQTNSDQDFKFSTSFISNDYLHVKAARVYFYAMCRYQLIGSEAEVIYETQQLYGLDAPNISQLNGLIKVYWKKNSSSTDTTSQAQLNPLVEHLKKQNEENVCRIRRLEYESNQLIKQKRAAHAECKNVHLKFCKYKKETEVEINTKHFAIRNLENKLREMMCKYDSLKRDFANHKNESEVEIARLSYLMSNQTQTVVKEIKYEQQHVDRLKLEEIFLITKEFYGDVRKVEKSLEKPLDNYTNSYLISQIIIYITSLKFTMQDIMCAKNACESELNMANKANEALNETNKILIARNNDIMESFKSLLSGSRSIFQDKD